MDSDDPFQVFCCRVPDTQQSQERERERVRVIRREKGYLKETYCFFFVCLFVLGFHLISVL